MKFRTLKESEPDDVHLPEPAQNTPAGAHESSILANKHVTRRRSDALVLMAEAFLRDTKVASHTDDRYQVVVHVDSKALSKEVFDSSDGKPDCYIEQQVAVPVETARRLSCSCKIVTALTQDGLPLNIGRSSRAIPTGIKRAMTIRDSACCFPGCDCHTHLDAHHIEHWADGGETSLDNLMQLCHYHHTLMHEGGFSVARVAGELVFKMPDGSDLSQSPRLKTSDRILPLQAGDIWQWCGDSMDYSVALTGLARADGRELAF